MPEIRIKSCNKTPNHDALEAVARWMRSNYTERNYQQSKVITVESGRKISVKELDRDDSEVTCNGDFEVKTLDK